MCPVYTTKEEMVKQLPKQTVSRFVHEPSPNKILFNLHCPCGNHAQCLLTTSCLLCNKGNFLALTLGAFSTDIVLWNLYLLCSIPVVTVNWPWHWNSHWPQTDRFLATGLAPRFAKLNGNRGNLGRNPWQSKPDLVSHVFFHKEGLAYTHRMEEC